MAKVIRNCWVYRKHNRWHRYLPRRHDGPTEYDYSKNNALPDNFSSIPIDDNPPKLWLVWLYRDLDYEPKWTKRHVKELFGDDYKPGKMEIMKNTASTNEALWHIKHLIELRPITFPYGEPTIDDVGHIELRSDGRCIVDKRLTVDDKCLQLVDTKKQMTPAYLGSRSAYQWHNTNDVFEDPIYMPSNISVQK